MDGVSATFLGRGSFGETWHVVRRDGTERAVKFILDPRYPQTLLDREVAGLKRVHDPRVVTLHAVSVATLQAGPTRALEFEFVEGGDVAARIATKSWPSPAESLAFLRQVLGGVATMHATDTVHRDIKPSNIALRGGTWSEPVLLDFGLAKQLSVETVTQYPSVMGTYQFMAPEQLRAEPARKLADVWAIGVIAYILLAQQHPFLDGPGTPVTPDQLLAKMAAGPRPLRLSTKRRVTEIVMRLLSFDGYARGSAARAYTDLMEAGDV